MNTQTKQTKHTKGPWTEGQAGILHLTGHRRIFMPGSVAAGVWSMGCEQSEVEANARLIAAAPEQNEALLLAEQLLARINHAFYVDGTAKALRPVMGETKAALGTIRAALAKARGEA